MPDPKILGVEGAGRVSVVGEGVKFRAGQGASPGSMRRAAMPSISLFRRTRLCRVPDGIDDSTAAP